MTEQQLIKKQLLKNMILNLVAFTTIFSILGLILYTQVNSSIYKSSDKELLNSKNRVGILEKIENGYKSENPNNTRPNNAPKQEEMVNPRIIYLIRNSNGEIVDQQTSYSTFENVKFDINNMNNIYIITVNNTYKYRGINYEIKKNGETYYIQILINVDAEESIMTNFTRTLIISIILSITIAILASYFLAKKTIKPIVKSWKKQTEFVQNASHELRTPLTIIQAKQELLLEEPESKILDKSEDISISLNETRRLSKLVKDLMELARADDNKIELKISNIEIDKLIKEVTEPFTEITNKEEKKIKLDLRYAKTIKADRNKIYQVLVIILDNSIKYTEKGDEITISTVEKDGKLLIDIADTGIGISNEAITHIFERFYREDKAHSRKTGGSGLGLSIAKTIIEQHGGNIKAMHNKPKGTIIQIKLKTIL